MIGKLIILALLIAGVIIGAPWLIDKAREGEQNTIAVQECNNTCNSAGWEYNTYKQVWGVKTCTCYKETWGEEE